MADEQDRPDEPRKATPPAAEPSAPGSPPPAKHVPAKAAKKAPAKAPKKAPAKAAKKGAAKKAAKKAPPPPAEAAPPPKPAPEPSPAPAPAPAPATLADTNGETPFAAADETAAQARQAVDNAGDTLAVGITRAPRTGAAVQIAVALVTAVLAILLIRRLLADD